MELHFNPFAKGRHISRSFSRYPKPMNMFDRTVGRPTQMGIFDYLLIAPFLLKFLFHASKGRSKFLTAVFGVMTVPFSIIKFALYVATSPVILLAWAIKKIVTKQIRKYATSPFTAALNRLIVKPVPLPGHDLGHTPSVALRQVNKLYDVSLMNHSIKVNAQNELIIVRSPGNALVAVVEPTRANIALLKELVGKPGHDGNRLDYALNNIGGNIFDHGNLSNIRGWLTQVSQEQEVDRINLIKRVLFVGDKSANKSPDIKPHPEATTTTFAHIPRDVRERIFGEALNNEVHSVGTRSGFFAGFTPDERKEGLEEYRQRSRVTK